MKNIKRILLFSLLVIFLAFSFTAVKGKPEVQASAYGRPSIASTNDGRIVMAWVGDFQGDKDIVVKILSNNGNVVQPDTKIVQSAGLDDYPSVTVDRQNNIWLAWRAQRNGENLIYLRAFSFNTGGKAKDIIKETLVVTAERGTPALAYDSASDKVWLTWNSGPDLFHAVYNLNGSIFRPATTVDTNGLSASLPAMAFDSRGKAWIAFRGLSSNNQNDIHYMALNPDGSVAASPTDISGNKLSDFPAIAVDREDKIWITYEWYGPGKQDVYGVIIDPGINTVKKLEISKDSGKINTGTFSALDLVTGNVWVGWVDFNGGLANNVINYKVLDPNGTPVVE